MDISRGLKARNMLDVALYDWIKERFDQSVSAPINPLVVEGKGRTDYEIVNLWYAIGSSPIRQAVMANSPEKHKPA